MTLLLITETAIIEHIFSLICNKLNILLTVQKTNNVTEKFDLIVIDQNFIDNKFNIIKQFSKKLGAITPEELPFDKSRDFIIPRPFLPTKLISLLKEQIEIIAEDEIQERIRQERIDRVNLTVNDDYYEEDEEVTIPVTTFIDGLDENIFSEEKVFNIKNDDSLILQKDLNIGGVLDRTELTKINQILKENSLQNADIKEQESWKNISDIIDEALEELQENEFSFSGDSENSYNLILSNYHIDELRPLLEKFNQSIIDKLSSGEEVDVKISLKGQ